ncbi:unnamed protein product [Lepeophtheirus salmonis]|uniref:(salmon louse) hypothetical protein n=1 Tax=Lepeophtheirus salmonis TaxID=72036 RepID=A0A7R8D0B7_LEPSM|nr:unnamed protein product [Lepeophtheirus salmonis]CAF2982858.1 unnamed protein product [Lepeophtheirus salmonis]
MNKTTEEKTLMYKEGGTPQVGDTDKDLQPEIAKDDVQSDSEEYNLITAFIAKSPSLQTTNKNVLFIVVDSQTVTENSSSCKGIRLPVSVSDSYTTGATSSPYSNKTANNFSQPMKNANSAMQTGLP